MTTTSCGGGYESKLFHALHRVSRPSLKEFREGFAFTAAVRRSLSKGKGKSKGKANDDSEAGAARFDVVIDVAGGHGLVAWLFLLLERQVEEAVVVDPADVKSGKRGLAQAWGAFLPSSGSTSTTTSNDGVRYRHECLRTGLPAELADCARRGKRVLVVACHACSHLSWEVAAIAQRHGAHVAVMPCCQNDLDGNWKALAKALYSNDKGRNGSKNGGSGGAKLKKSGNGGSGGVPPANFFATIMDLLLCGRMMQCSSDEGGGGGSGGSSGSNVSNGSSGSGAYAYRVRMSLIDAAITPQNRVVIGRAVRTRDSDCGSGDARGAKRERSHVNMTRAYHRAHRDGTDHGKLEAIPSSSSSAVTLPQTLASTSSSSSSSSSFASSSSRSKAAHDTRRTSRTQRQKQNQQQNISGSSSILAATAALLASAAIAVGVCQLRDPQPQPRSSRHAPPIALRAFEAAGLLAAASSIFSFRAFLSINE